MPKRRAQPFRETQMVSLADIAFLLIFFFMLSSQFMRDKVQINLPWLGFKVDRTDAGHSVSMDASGKLYLDGQAVEAAESLEGKLTVLLAGRTEAKQREVRFKCDRNVTYRIYHPVFEAISAAGGIIAIMHEVKKN